MKKFDINEVKYELARRNYIDYLALVNGTTFIKGKHIVYIANKVQEFIDNKDDSKKVLCLSVPPQHGKSLTISEALPSWFVGKHPGKATMIISYGEDLAKQFGRANKRKVEEFGEAVFGITMSKESASVVEWEVEKIGLDSLRKGVVRSLGITGGIAGKPADLVIIDDPIKSRADAESPTYRERIWYEYIDGVKARLSAKGKIIIIQTRWHEDDLIGRVLEAEKDGVIYINIPLEAEEDDILGRKVGDTLFPEIGKDKKWLKSFKKVYDDFFSFQVFIDVYFYLIFAPFYLTFMSDILILFLIFFYI
jgi:hypothetical protein